MKEKGKGGCVDSFDMHIYKFRTNWENVCIACLHVWLSALCYGFQISDNHVLAVPDRQCNFLVLFSLIPLPHSHVNNILGWFIFFLTLKSAILQEITDTFFTLELYFKAVLLGIIVTGMPPYFAMENAENHKVT